MVAFEHTAYHLSVIISDGSSMTAMTWFDKDYENRLLIFLKILPKIFATSVATRSRRRTVDELK